MDVTEIVKEAAQFPPELWAQIIGFSTTVAATITQAVDWFVTYKRGK